MKTDDFIFIPDVSFADFDTLRGDDGLELVNLGHFRDFL